MKLDWHEHGPNPTHATSLTHWRPALVPPCTTECCITAFKGDRLFLSINRHLKDERFMSIQLHGENLAFMQHVAEAVLDDACLPFLGSILAGEEVEFS